MHAAVTAEQTGPNSEAMRTAYAQNVLEGRIANKTNDILSSKETKAKIETLDNEVKKVEEEVQQKQKDVEDKRAKTEAAAGNMVATEHNYDPSPANQETAAPLQQATNQFVGAVEQQREAESWLEQTK